jgi:signal transduction histidine kinase
MLICGRAAELVDSVVSTICVKDDAGTRIVAGVGLSPELIGMRLPDGMSFAERVIEGRELMEVARRTELSEVEMPQSTPDGPTLGVPVVAGGAATASLTFVREVGSRAWSQSDRLFAEAVAAQAALAFELDRAQRDREEMMLVEDRERIGRDLHDNVIQQLFALGLSLQATHQVATGATAERLSGAVEVLDEVIREIRNTIFAANRRFPVSPGAQHQLQALIEEMTAPLGFSPRLRVLGGLDEELPEIVLDHLLAVLRESLSNISRHAGATRVDVVLDISSQAVKLSVADDGIGLPVQPTAGNGLANMAERARLVKGSFATRPRTPSGTILEWQARL